MFEVFKKPTPAEPATEQPTDTATDTLAPPERTGMDVLAHGTLRKAARERADRDGKLYSKAVMSVHREGLASLPVILLSHVPNVSFTLATMRPGDALSITGNLLLTNDGSVAINCRRLVSPFPTQTRKSK